jgi:hypothetical protein
MFSINPSNNKIKGMLYVVCLGVYYGYDELHKQQMENMEILLNCTTENGNKVRPKEYRISSITEFIE